MKAAQLVYLEKYPVLLRLSGLVLDDSLPSSMGGALSGWQLPVGKATQSEKLTSQAGGSAHAARHIVGPSWERRDAQMENWQKRK